MVDFVVPGFGDRDGRDVRQLPRRLVPGSRGSDVAAVVISGRIAGGFEAALRNLRTPIDHVKTKSEFRRGESDFSRNS